MPLFAQKSICRHDPSLCDGTFRGSKVTLRGLELEGDVPSQLGLLRQLTHLDLSVNKLSGEGLPTELGRLYNLEELRVDNNMIRGTIPAELGNLRKLKRLILFHNSISGTIPAQLGRLGQLRALFLQNNRLYGELPRELGQLRNLESLAIYDNYLGGRMPSQLWWLGRLSYCQLAQWRTTAFDCPLPPLPDACDVPRCVYSPPSPPAPPPTAIGVVVDTALRREIQLLLLLLLLALALHMNYDKLHPHCTEEKRGLYVKQIGRFSADMGAALRRFCLSLPGLIYTEWSALPDRVIAMRKWAKALPDKAADGSLWEEMLASGERCMRRLRTWGEETATLLRQAAKRSDESSDEEEEDSDDEEEDSSEGSDVEKKRKGMRCRPTSAERAKRKAERAKRKAEAIAAKKEAAAARKATAAAAAAAKKEVAAANREVSPKAPRSFSFGKRPKAPPAAQRLPPPEAAAAASAPAKPSPVAPPPSPPEDPSPTHVLPPAPASAPLPTSASPPASAFSGQVPAPLPPPPPAPAPPPPSRAPAPPPPAPPPPVPKQLVALKPVSATSKPAPAATDASSPQKALLAEIQKGHTLRPVPTPPALGTRPGPAAPARRPPPEEDSESSSGPPSDSSDSDP